MPCTGCSALHGVHHNEKTKKKKKEKEKKRKYIGKDKRQQRSMKV